MLPCQLNRIRGYFITITRSTVEIRLNCNDVWTPLLEHLLQPIENTEFKIWLYIDDCSWHKFINAFTRVFEPLSTQGSYIDFIRIGSILSDSQMIKLIEIDESLKLLSTFKIRRLWINDWYVTEESFKILSEDILFEGWIFGKNIKYKEYWILN